MLVTQVYQSKGEVLPLREAQALWLATPCQGSPGSSLDRCRRHKLRPALP